MRCQRFLDLPLSRREMLCQSVNGFGAVALAALSADWSSRDARADVRTRLPNFAPRAKNVIFLYMDGGPSQIATFDPKPRLAREHGLSIKIKIPVTAERDVGRVMKSPWNFRRHGESGLPISGLFPHLARHADDLCVIRSMAGWSNRCRARRWPKNPCCPFGFSIWLAGGGVKAGTIYGATDEYGYYAVENPVEIHDLHATMLHLLGIDHTKLIVRHNGRDLRLTDVHGNVVRGVIA